MPPKKDKPSKPKPKPKPITITAGEVVIRFD